MAINKFSKKCCTPRFDRGVNFAFSNKSRSFAPLRTTPIYVPYREGAKLQAKKAAGFFCTMPGRLEFVHLHALNGVHSVPPPPPFNNSHTNRKTSFFYTLFLFSLGKMPDFRLCAEIPVFL